MFAESVNILGVSWRIVFGDKHTYPYLKRVTGFCDRSTRTIVVLKLRDTPKPHEMDDPREEERNTLRHEIVHAFFFESGVSYNSSAANHWAMHEEMVDWIAQQHEKIHAAFIAAGAI